MEIGTHCDLANCSALDFLPFKCPYCSLTFCRDHRLEHNCANNIDRTIAVVNAGTVESTKMACSLESCSAVEKIISQCSHCDMVFCLAHRHAPDHSCRGVVKEAEEAKDKKEAIRAFVEKGVKGPTLGPTPKPASSTVPKKKVNYALELMKMKQSAKGDVSIPPESRVYLRVHFPAESSMNSETLYFHKDWPVGRLVDRLAISAQVRNVNNTNDEEMKLVLYNGESRERLPMNESLTSLLNAKKLQQAGSIIMERVSLPCTPL